MSKQRYKSTSVSVETILHHVALHTGGASTHQIRDSIDIVDGFDLGNKMFSIAVNNYVSKEKPAGGKGHNLYAITKEGKALLKRNPHKIQNPEQIEYIAMGDGDGRQTPATRGPYKDKAAIESVAPAPTYSSAAQSAMDTLASIVDANQGAKDTLEQVFLLVSRYMENNPINDLDTDGGPFKAVIEETMDFRSLIQDVLNITEPEMPQGNEVNEPSQERLIS